MDGPAAVISLVLAETAAGGTALLWLTGLWGRVKRGYFILTEAVILACAILVVLTISGAVPAGEPGRTAVLLSSVSAGVLALSLAALVLRRTAIGRVLGIAAVPVSVAALVGLARLAGPSLPVALLHLLAGAAFMGAVTDGLLLGHWYLTDRRLPREHIQRFATLLIAAVVLEAVAVLALGFGPTETAAQINPFLSIAGLATWLALGMVACTALIAILIRSALRSPRTRAVQAATGFFYLAVITAFTAEMAAKIRFLG
jgi:hypothetical protein